MTRLRATSGMSIVEVLAAVAVFAIVAAGAAAGTISTIRGTHASWSTSIAAALIHDKLEQLRALDPAANPPDLQAGSHADANNPLTDLGAAGGSYTRTWQVFPNSPRRGLLEVRVTITWNDGVARTLRGATYFCRQPTCA